MSQPHHDQLPPPSRAERVELVISNLLRWGVFASLLLLVIGSVISFAFSGRYGHAPGDTDALITAAGAFPAHDVGWLIDGLRHGRGQAIIVLGLFLLILTPLLRVVVSIVAFTIERDWAFVGITAIVLVLLTISFLIGGAS